MPNNLINMEQSTENEFFKGARPGQRRSVRSDADGISSRLKGTAYYGWYKTLRASESYRETCRNKGEGRLASMYEDFGDVYMPWDMWAARYGRKIFTERQALPRAEQIRKSDVENMRFTQDNILLNVPLTISRVTLMRQIGKIIKDNHAGRKLDVFKRSTSKRPLLKSRVQMPMIEILLEVMVAFQKDGRVEEAMEVSSGVLVLSRRISVCSNTYRQKYEKQTCLTDSNPCLCLCVCVCVCRDLSSWRLRRA